MAAGVRERSACIAPSCETEIEGRGKFSSLQSIENSRNRKIYRGWPATRSEVDGASTSRQPARIAVREMAGDGVDESRGLGSTDVDRVRAARVERAAGGRVDRVGRFAADGRSRP